MKADGLSIRSWVLGIVGTVIATVIAGWILNHWIPSLGKFTTTAALQLQVVATYTIGVPVWGLSLIILLTVPTLVQSWKVTRGPTWLSYTADHFYGMYWRWRYWQRKYCCDNVADLQCYCPDDDTALVHYEDGHEWGGVPKTVTWQCETCGRGFGPIPGNTREIKAAIERQIDRNIRNGQWRTANATNSFITTSV